MTDHFITFKQKEYYICKKSFRLEIHVCLHLHHVLKLLRQASNQVILLNLVK